MRTDIYIPESGYNNNKDFSPVSHVALVGRSLVSLWCFFFQVSFIMAENTIDVELHSPRSARIFAPVASQESTSSKEVPVSRYELKAFKDDILNSISALVDSKLSKNDTSPNISVDQNNPPQR